MVSMEPLLEPFILVVLTLSRSWQEIRQVDLHVFDKMHCIQHYSADAAESAILLPIQLVSFPHI